MKIQKCRKNHHFLMLWPWPLTYDLEKLIRSGHYHYQCVYQIWEQSIPWFLSYRVNTIAGGGRRVAGGGRLQRKTITSPNPSDTGDIITILQRLGLFVGSYLWSALYNLAITLTLVNVALKKKKSTSHSSSCLPECGILSVCCNAYL